MTAPAPITLDDLAASRWDTTFIDGSGWSQRRTKCRNHPVELVVTSNRRSVTRRYQVHDVDIGGTVEEAVAALNDWSIVQRALDAESAHNNVDDGDLYGTRRRLEAAKAAARTAPPAEAARPEAPQGSFDFS